MRTLYKTSEGKLIQTSGADSALIVFVNLDEAEKRELDRCHDLVEKNIDPWLYQ